MNDEQAVRRVVEGIGEAFSTLDVGAWYRCFNPTFIIASPMGPVAIASEDECRAFIGAMFEGLRERGMVRTRLDACSVEFLSPGAAVATTAWTRFDADDAIIGKLRAAYVLVRADEVWRVTMLISLPEDATGSSART